jgi:serine/threonine protein kinase
VYSYGAVVWERITNNIPWKDYEGTVPTLAQQIESGEIGLMHDVLEQDILPIIYDLLQRCLSYDPSREPESVKQPQRPLFREIVDILQEFLDSNSA